MWLIVIRRIVKDKMKRLKSSIKEAIIILEDTIKLGKYKLNKKVSFYIPDVKVDDPNELAVAFTNINSSKSLDYDDWVKLPDDQKMVEILYWEEDKAQEKIAKEIQKGLQKEFKKVRVFLSPL